MNKEKFIIICSVEHKAGVLNKILSLCRRRRYSLSSVSAGSTEDPKVYNITLTLFEKKDRINQIVNQINKIIEVISAEAFLPKDVIDKELVLLIVNNKKVISQIIKNKEHDINIRVLKNMNKNIIFEIIGEGNEVEHVLNTIDKKDIIRLVHSGSVAIKL